MVPLVVTIESHRATWSLEGLAQSAINSLVREALLAPAQYWINNILEGHFKAGASAKYGYPSRSQNYLRKKQYAATVQSWPKGRWHGARLPNPNYHKSPAPFVYTGDLYDFVMENARSGRMKPKATATANVQKVEVLVQYSHPLRTEDAGMITRRTAAESDVLHGVFQRRLRELMRGAASGMQTRMVVLAA